MISPDMLAFAVRALVRIGGSAADAYEQSVRDAEIRIENLPAAERFDADQDLWSFFWDPNKPELMARSESGDLKSYWTEQRDIRDSASRAHLVEEYTRLIAADSGQTSKKADSAFLLKQWSNGAGPPAPMVRVALAFADVALDFISSKPGIIGVGSDGEKLIAALGTNLRSLLPAADDPAAWQGEGGTAFAFAQRAAALMLNAGLKTLIDNADVVVHQSQYSTLLKNVLTPAVEAFKTNPLQRPSLEAARDLLLGPMTQAALKTLRDQQTAFLGASFDPASTAIGAITEAVLGQAASVSAGELLTRGGLLRLYDTVLQVAVAQPRLFIKDDGVKSDAARQIVSSVAGALKAAHPPFSGDSGVELAAAVIASFRDNMRPFVGTNAWQAAAADLLGEVLSGLQIGLGDGTGVPLFASIFSKDKAVALITSIVQRVAQSPEMLSLATGRQEVGKLVAVIVSSAVSNNGRLLSADDWTAIAELMAQEMVRNPLRLVDPAAAPETQLIAKVLTGILTAAAANVPTGQRNTGTLLFGDTLRACITIALSEVANNTSRAVQHLTDLQRLIDLINQAAAQNSDLIGAKRWLALFEAHVKSVLDGGLAPAVTTASLVAEIRSSP